MKMKTLATYFILLFFASQTQAALIVELSIENQEVHGTEFFFDVYLTRHASSTGDIYLGDADFVLQFNAQFFTNPVFGPVANDVDGTGFCTFAPASEIAQDEPGCRAGYFANTATAIIDNQLVINLFGPFPNGTSGFGPRIARIDGEVEKHRLGRFKITGINDHDGTAGLAWAESGVDRLTKVFSYLPAQPWAGFKVEILATPPPDAALDSIVSNVAEPLAMVGIEKIYPNPGVGPLVVEFYLATAEKVKISVLGPAGLVFLEENHAGLTGENRVRLNAVGFANGIYLLKIKGEGFEWVRQVFIGS